MNHPTCAGIELLAEIPIVHDAQHQRHLLRDVAVPALLLHQRFGHHLYNSKMRKGDFGYIHPLMHNKDLMLPPDRLFAEAIRLRVHTNCCGDRIRTRGTYKFVLAFVHKIGINLEHCLMRNGSNDNVEHRDNFG